MRAAPFLRKFNRFNGDAMRIAPGLCRLLAAGLLLCLGAAAQAQASEGARPCAGYAPSPDLPAGRRALEERRKLKIVALGSSSTEGVGASAPDRAYPARLEAELRAAFPNRSIKVVNRGVGGEEVPEMLARLDRDVLADKPDIVIWQMAANAMIRGVPAQTLRAGIHEGVARIRAAGADVLLMSPQYAPRLIASGRSDEIAAQLASLATAEKAPLFPRYEIMKAWRDAQGIPFADFLIGDGLHLNDWAYACTAQLLARAMTPALQDPAIRTAGAR